MNRYNILKKNIDHEFFVQLSVTDENLSWYIEDNIETYCGDPASVDKNDDDFIKTNLMHGDYCWKFQKAKKPKLKYEQISSGPRL